MTECTAVGPEKCNCASNLKECEMAVHYETGYVPAVSVSLGIDLAYKTLTTLCGTGVSGHMS